jgi:hypothetical protein
LAKTIRVLLIPFITLLFILITAGFSSFVPQLQTTPVKSSPTPIPLKTSESWIMLPDLGSNATQADYGAEIWRLVCQDCHGDKGQGLTGEWRATWHENDQNCWQSHCHDLNHPPEGFTLPRYIPGVMKPKALQRFKTAEDLYLYVLEEMPWYNPGSLLPREAMMSTAYMLRMNGIDPGTIPLDETRAKTILIHSESNEVINTPYPTTIPTPSPTPLQSSQPAAVPSLFVYAGIVGGLICAGLFIWLRLRPKNTL